MGELDGVAQGFESDGSAFGPGEIESGEVVGLGPLAA